MERSDTGGEPLVASNNDTGAEQISESIVRLRDEVDRIESTTGPSKRTHCMRTEIGRLEALLTSCGNGAEDHTDPVFEDTPLSTASGN